MGFDENKHSRASDGRFAEKAGTKPDDGFAAFLAEELRLARERDRREGVCGEDYDHTETVTYEDETLIQWRCETCGAEGEVNLLEEGPVRDQFGNFPPGMTIADLVFDEDGDEDSDVSQKFSTLRSYPDGIPAKRILT